MEKKVAEILAGIALIGILLILILGVTYSGNTSKDIIVTNNINVNSNEDLEKVYVQEPKIIEKPIYEKIFIERPFYNYKENPNYFISLDFEKRYNNGEIVYRKSPYYNYQLEISQEKQIVWSEEGVEVHNLPRSWAETTKDFRYVYN